MSTASEASVRALRFSGAASAMLVAALLVVPSPAAEGRAHTPPESESPTESLGAQDSPGPHATTFWEVLGETRDLSGRRWGPAALAGKVVLVDFWATWCAPCLAELPTLRAAHERYWDRGLQILGISLDSADRRTLQSWLRRQRVSWPQIHTPRGLGSPLARRFAVESLPRSVLLDRQGRQIATDLRGEALLAVLASLFPEPGGD